ERGGAHEGRTARARGDRTGRERGARKPRAAIAAAGIRRHRRLCRDGKLIGEGRRKPCGLACSNGGRAMRKAGAIILITLLMGTAAAGAQRKKPRARRSAPTKAARTEPIGNTPRMVGSPVVIITKNDD